MSEGRSRRAPLIIGGAVVAVTGLVVAGGLWFAASQRLDDSIAGLARATVGCDTVLDFDTGGEYILFVETRGRIDDVRGDCNAADEFEWSGDEGEIPSAVLTLTGPDGDELVLSRRNGVSYDSAGFAGTSIRSVTIDEGGDHALRVESADLDFAVAVGRNPDDGVGGLRLGGLLAGLVGLVVGTTLVLAGLRRRRSPGAAPRHWDHPPVTDVGWPSSPPGFPAPPPTTGTSAAVGPPSSPTVRVPTAPLPVPPVAVERPAEATSRVPTPARWGPPTSPDR